MMGNGELHSTESSIYIYEFGLIVVFAITEFLFHRVL